MLNKFINYYPFSGDTTASYNTTSVVSVRVILSNWLSILSYPSGFHSRNLLFIISIMISALVACFIRIFGFEVITSSTNETVLYLGTVFFLFNTTYLKFYICTKIYYLFIYTNSNNIPLLNNRIFYIFFINIALLSLISLLIYRNENALLSSTFINYNI